MSQTKNYHGDGSTYRSLNRRTVAEIERKVGKHGKRNAMVRFILTKGDKDKIAAWKQDLVRVLHVFNVCTNRPLLRILKLIGLLSRPS